MSDVKKAEAIKSDFDPEAYLADFMSDPDSSEYRKGVFYFAATGFHKFFQTGIKGKRLLDISTGPNPYSVVSATPVVEEIYLSDFVPANRVYLQKLVTGTTSKDYFGPVVKVHTEVENAGNVWEKRIEEMKSKVVGIFPVDVTKDDPLAPNIFPQFDVITSSFAFECAVYNNPSDYTALARRVTELLKPGGHLVVGGFINETYYCFGGVTYYVFPLTRELAQKSFEQAGCILKGWEEMPRPKDETMDIADYTSVFVMHFMKK